MEDDVLYPTYVMWIINNLLGLKPLISLSCLRLNNSNLFEFSYRWEILFKVISPIFHGNGINYCFLFSLRKWAQNLYCLHVSTINNILCNFPQPNWGTLLCIIYIKTVTSRSGALTKLILWGHLLASDLDFSDINTFMLDYDAFW